jgi:hypothetical protein
MRFLLRLLLILGLSFLALRSFPWWSVAVVAFVVGLMLSQQRKRRLFGRRPPPARSFWAGFVALFVLWGSFALYYDQRNDSILGGKIAGLFSLPDDLFIGSSLLLVLVTALVGGLLGGLSAMTGNLMGEAIKA